MTIDRDFLERLGDALRSARRHIVSAQTGGGEEHLLVIEKEAPHVLVALEAAQDDVDDALAEVERRQMGVGV